MVSTGFQASNLGDAIQVVNQMTGGFLMRVRRRIAARRRGMKSIEIGEVQSVSGFHFQSDFVGVRDTVRYLTEHHMVSFALEMLSRKDVIL
ncbi:hypothetical protein CK203_097382 [Vitis vinifera]|uniref:Uncharacterized protein n=1 Tax=Vitis vinifera TaxID=29760 RepID=A0A438EXL7_VITVI|nr:hypothetical protein CK203_097382 [Vitis vinifera]